MNDLAISVALSFIHLTPGLFYNEYCGDEYEDAKHALRKYYSFGWSSFKKNGKSFTLTI